MAGSSSDGRADSIEAINASASALMKQGIARLEERRPRSAAEALEFFDRALQMRLDLPVETDSFLAYLLAACWLNRGDALMQIGEADKIAAAVHSYDEGIAALSHARLEEDPRFARRLAMGYQNRGLALQAQGAAAVPSALDSFDRALDVLESDAARPLTDRSYLLAGVWTNIAIARAEARAPDTDALARTAALHAIGLVANLERDDAPSAEIGLKARHVLCQVIAGRLPTSEGATPAAMPDDVHEATDLAEAGLALARRWEAQGEMRFWPLAHDLFVFGAAVYQLYQPQFVEEFLRDHQHFATA